MILRGIVMKEPIGVAEIDPRETGPTEPEHVSLRQDSGLALWTRRFLGRTALRACRWRASKPCPKVNCVLQPFCACARADWAAAQKAEGRVWAVVGACGALVLAIALARAFLF